MRKSIRRDMWILAIFGVVAASSGVAFYYLQYRLTMSLWDAFNQMEIKADEWRTAFIQKRQW